MKGTRSHPPSDLPRRLCLHCAICCNGVLFKDVVLQRGDRPRILREAGLSLRTRGGKVRLQQPCPALAGCHCRVYEDRPGRCAQFECLLFQAVADGATSLASARRVVRRALRKAEEIRAMMRGLGDTDEARPLQPRFDRLRRRMEQAPVDPGQARLYGDLTVAMQELNHLLAERFYSG